MQRAGTRRLTATNLPHPSSAGKVIGGMSISVVLPTSRRAAALRHTFPLIRRLRSVEEIIVVPDGPDDPAVGLLRHETDPRVRVEPVPVGSGSPAARNLGARVASGPWILFLEDDCGFPPGYAAALRAEAERHGADIAGAPMVQPRPGERLSEAVTRAKSDRAGARTLDEIAAFPHRPAFTPFLPAPSIVARRVFNRLAFDEGFLLAADRVALIDLAKDSNVCGGVGGMWR